ncbi:MAG: pentapeptide repeat-containing protein [Candidatus Aquilonibacter sp.]
MPSSFEVIARVALVVLVNSLWQGAAIAGLTWLALRVFPRVNASTRYAAWTVALVAVLVVPIATSLSRVSTYTLPATTTNSAASNPIQKMAASVPKTAAQSDAAGGASRSEHKQEKASGARHSQGGTLSGLTLPKVPDLHVNMPFLFATIFFTAWGIAALALVVRLTVALIRLERLKQDAMPLGMEYRDQLVQWQRLDAHERDVRICVTDGIEVPVAVGLFDAMVLLPQHLLAEFDAQEIDQISLHELAHLLRHDDWSNGLQRVISALLFFNPAVWFIARQMDIEREVACDDYVLELTGAVRTYAFCLTKMAEMTSWPHQPLAAPGVFTTRKNISIRIERLLRTGRAIGSSISPATATLVAIGLVAGYLLAFSLTPVVAFAMPCPPAVASVPPVMAAPPVHQFRSEIVKVAPLKVATPKMDVSLPQVPLTIPNVTVTVAPAKSVVASTAGLASRISSEVDSSIAKALKPLRVVASVDDVHGGMNCSGCDFQNQNLAGKNFAGSNLTGSDFSHTNLQGANFNGAKLSGVDFQGADLRNASFIGANLSGANLDGAKLDGANLDHANLSGSDINVRSLSQAQIRAYLPRCNGCDLHGANLSGMDLRGIKLTGVDLSHANLRGANLQDAIFSGVDFSGADLRGANTDGTKFIGCDFSGASLAGP